MEEEMINNTNTTIQIRINISNRIWNNLCFVFSGALCRLHENLSVSLSLSRMWQVKRRFYLQRNGMVVRIYLYRYKRNNSLWKKEKRKEKKKIFDRSAINPQQTEYNFILFSSSHISLYCKHIHTVDEEEKKWHTLH